MEYHRAETDKFRLSYSSKNFLHDIDKVMCLLSRKNIENIITIETALKKKFEEIGYVGPGSFDNQIESTFFNLKFFKKGTMRLYFKDEFLWQEFNLRAAKGKNWLPDDYNKRESA